MHASHAQGKGKATVTRTLRPHAPQGRLIRWARFYDPLVWVMSLGQTRSAEIVAARIGSDQARRAGIGRWLRHRRPDPGCREASRLRWNSVRHRRLLQMIDVARRKAKNAHRPVEFRVEAVESLSFPDGRSMSC